MSSIDIEKLSYVELRELSRKLDLQIAEKRAEELKVLADGYVKKIQASGFTVAEAVAAVEPYLPALQRRVSGVGSGVVAAVYRDPANEANSWSGRGRAPKWLVAYEAEGRLRSEFKV